MSLRLGSLFTGMGGLDLAVRAALGDVQIETVWHCDIKPASVAWLCHRHPNVPNLGDLTRAFPVIGPITREAAELEPVDLLAFSYPCQPESAAGKRLGEKDPRAILPNALRAVAEIRPAVVFVENVARIAGNGSLRHLVRGLADLGYVGAWRCQRASDVGACHRRDRCFVVAVDPARAGTVPHGRPGGGLGVVRGVRGDGLTLLPTPHQNMTTGAGTSGRAGGLNLQTAVALLPTPSASNYGTNQGGAAGRVGALRESLDTMARRGRFELLPTPKATDGPKGGPGMRGSSGDLALPSAVQPHHFGVYAEAVRRHEQVFGRPAPAPTHGTTRGGNPQLSARFVEWMQMLPEGWVTDVPNLATKPGGQRNAQLSLLGDGVVPPQGAAAFRFLLDHLADRLSGRWAA